VISLSRSYHGTTIGAMSVTGEHLEHEAYAIDRRDVIIIPTPRPTWCACQTEGLQAANECSRLLVEIAEREGDKVAAIILEPILGSAGVLELPQTFLERVRGVCDEHDILLIVDEVATGFGRTGRMFASEWFDLQPDIVILSKGINSGYLPLGAAAFNEKIFEAFWRAGAIFLHGETQAGNPLACAAGLATLEVIEKEGLVARVEEVGARLLKTLRGLERHQHVACVGGRGLMLGVHLARGSGRGLPVGTDVVILAVRQLAREGLLVHPAPSGISLFPPLVLSEADADRIAELLDLVLGRLVLA
jgi:adenosylmethionine-8-amino-7-oxononanoate aminotransferase